MVPVMSELNGKNLSSAVAFGLRVERGRKGLRQEDLGRMVGWSRMMVCETEALHRKVTVDDLPLLCRAFDVPLAQLIERARPRDLAALRLGSQERLRL